jgi:biopolymer transport protein ExbD
MPLTRPLAGPLARQRSMRLIANIDASAFAGILVVLLFAMMTAGALTRNPHHGIGVDLAKVSHPVSMPGALREDAMLITVRRDGQIYFGFDRINPVALTEKIRDRLKDRGVERKVYIRADSRAMWGAVKVVVDGARSAGILRVAFLAEQRR